MDSTLERGARDRRRPQGSSRRHWSIACTPCPSRQSPSSQRRTGQRAETNHRPATWRSRNRPGSATRKYVAASSRAIVMHDLIHQIDDRKPALRRSSRRVSSVSGQLAARLGARQRGKPARVAMSMRPSDRPGAGGVRPPGTGDDQSALDETRKRRPPDQRGAAAISAVIHRLRGEPRRASQRSVEKRPPRRGCLRRPRWRSTRADAEDTRNPSSPSSAGHAPGHCRRRFPGCGRSDGRKCPRRHGLGHPDRDALIFPGTLTPMVLRAGRAE